MRKPLRLRRYLVHFSSYNVPQIFTDVLVLGSGVAGLSVVLGLPEGVSAVVVSKGSLQESATAKAQGGVAAAVAVYDSPQEHLEDTMSAGAGLCDEAAVRVVTEEAPARIQELIDLGVPFDREGSELSLTIEGGHHKARILHANGDATGRAIEEIIVQRTLERGQLEVMEDTFALDLLTLEGVCHGALVWSEARGLIMVRAKQTVLATGGCGPSTARPRNPPVATGDGVAMAFRAGASLQRPGVRPVPPHHALRRRRRRAPSSASPMRGEGAILRQPRRGALHAPLPRGGRAGPARRGQPQHHRADGATPSTRTSTSTPAT